MSMKGHLPRINIQLGKEKVKLQCAPNFLCLVSILGKAGPTVYLIAEKEAEA